MLDSEMRRAYRQEIVEKVDNLFTIIDSYEKDIRELKYKNSQLYLQREQDMEKETERLENLYATAFKKYLEKRGEANPDMEFYRFRVCVEQEKGKK